MRRLLFAMSVAALLLIGAVPSAFAAEWRVPGDFATIQEAVDSPDVSAGDVIYVGPGFHAGALLTKPVEIRGEGRAVINAGPAHPDSGKSQGFRLLAGSSLGLGQRQPLASCTITNVPGPAIPLYLNGARMTYFSAIMPINDGLGLVFAVTSYDGRIIVSPTSCREQMPDPEVFAQCVRDAFQDYLALARAGSRAKSKAPARRQVKPPSAGPSSAGRRDRSGPTARTAATVPRAARGGPRRSRARAH